MLSRRNKKPSSLLQLCLRYVARNLERFKHTDCIECLPQHLKNGLLEKRTRMQGFSDDYQLKTLLNRHTLRLMLSSSTITDATLENVAQLCIDLQTLRLTDGNFQFTTHQLLDTFPRLRSLQEIYLQNSDQMTDEVVQCIAQNCRGLTVLDIGRSTRLTDKCVEFISGLKLTHLNLSHSKIGDTALTQLAASECGQHLVDLNISYSRVTSKGLAELNWDQIKYIGFEGCDIVDMDFISNGKQLKYIQWTIP